MENGLVQQTRFPQTYQRRYGKLIVVGIALEMISGITQLLAEQTNIVLDFRAFWPINIIQTINAAAIHNILCNPFKHNV